jgi:hypothetical protein
MDGVVYVACDDTPLCTQCNQGENWRQYMVAINSPCIKAATRTLAYDGGFCVNASTGTEVGDTKLEIQ